MHAHMISCFGCVWLFAALWTAAHQAALPWDSLGKNAGLAVAMPSSRDLPDPGIESASLMSLALACGFFTTSATWEALRLYMCV